MQEHHPQGGSFGSAGTVASSLCDVCLMAHVANFSTQGRLLALGRIEGKPYAVVFQPLGTEAVSVISLRIASIKERRLL